MPKVTQLVREEAEFEPRHSDSRILAFGKYSEPLSLLIVTKCSSNTCPDLQRQQANQAGLMMCSLEIPFSPQSGSCRIFLTLFTHGVVFFFCHRNRAGAEKSRSCLQIQRHSYKDLARCVAARVFAATSCLCLFIVKLNGQNSKYSSLSNSEAQQAVERTAQHVPGPFYLLLPSLDYWWGWRWCG